MLCFKRLESEEPQRKGFMCQTVSLSIRSEEISMVCGYLKRGQTTWKGEIPNLEKPTEIEKTPAGPLIASPPKSAQSPLELTQDKIASVKQFVLLRIVED